MKQRLPLLILLGSSLTFLASLYLPWESASDTNSKLGVTIHSGSFDGWASSIGAAAGVAALALAAVVVAALLRPHLAARLPVGRMALLTAYLAVAGAVQLRSVRGTYQTFGAFRSHVELSYGTYLALAIAANTLVAAVVLRREEVFSRPRPERLLALALGLGLLVAFLLPWHEFPLPIRGAFRLLGTSSSSLIAAAILCLGATRWGAKEGPEVPLAGLAVVVLTGATIAVGLGTAVAPFPVRIVYGAWLGLGLSLALLGVSARHIAWRRAQWRPSREVVLLAVPALALLTALFLPWQSSCFPQHGVPRQYAGLCTSADGWATLPGTLAGALALGLVALLVLPGRRAPTVRIASAIGLFVTTAGFRIEQPFEPVGFGYGSYIGFAAAGLLLLAAMVLADLRRAASPERRILVLLVPLAASVALLVVIAVPWWQVLPERLQYQALDHRGYVDWLSVVAAIIALQLIYAWGRRIAGPRHSDGLTLQPLLALTLVGLELIATRDYGLTWGGGIVVGLCLLLACLGWIEERGGGLERFRVPEEIWRVDRLPGAED